MLPQGKQQTSAKPLTRVVIDKDLNYYAAFGNEKEQMLALEELTPFLQNCATKEPEMYVALYADESVPYREIVRILNIANENHFKMVLATRPPETRK
ncbi:biopolymer transport protein ExbD/TolR [Bacteroides reticulotermitis JCM 10512]|uniref:Biopolymer transport protein ExbD/TolR n=1 Tax=Bacteroides reticulotermitis JCM 10512 TaxID=1445607 RepID=W4UMU9_9BACE|nr:biopolymer transport protein ExbD/TolR [Bacteroides reticulotermitis JCM 10512]